MHAYVCARTHTHASGRKWWHDHMPRHNDASTPLPLTRLSSLLFACARSPFLRPPSPRPLSCSRSHRPSFLCTRRSARGWRRWAQKSRLPAVCSSVLDPLHPCLCVCACSTSVCICLMPATDGRMCVCSHVCVRAFFSWHSAFLLWMFARGDVSGGAAGAVAAAIGAASGAMAAIYTTRKKDEETGVAGEAQAPYPQ